MMISAITSDEAKKKAMETGADAYIGKPFAKEIFLQKLNDGILVNQQGRKSASILNKGTAQRSRAVTGFGVASSTGGPQTLLKVFSDIPFSDRTIFFLVQHGPPWMLTSFVERLQQVTPMKVQLGADGMKYAPGNIYIAPGDIHMIVDPVNEVLRLVDDPPENYCKPAADPLFRSIASAFGPSSMSMVLSGMGRDGTIGSGYIRAAGGTVFAQDPATAILPSMPQSVAELKIATHIIPLETLGKEVSRIINGSMAIQRPMQTSQPVMA
jgi:two-component system chemotaxis response regulator CheB